MPTYVLPQSSVVERTSDLRGEGFFGMMPSVGAIPEEILEETPADSVADQHQLAAD